VPVSAGLVGGQVDGEAGGADDRVAAAAGPAQGCAEPGEQLVHTERLGDEVDGTRLPVRACPTAAAAAVIPTMTRLPVVAVWTVSPSA